MESKKIRIAGEPLPDIPLQDRPEGCRQGMWRCDRNPIIGRHELSTSNAICNAA